MWWIILLACILAGFIYLLFVPFFIEINSVSKLFRVRFHRWVSATLIVNEKPVLIELIVLRWKKQIDLSRFTRSDRKPAEKTGPGKQTKFQIRKAIPLIRSFRINEFFLTIDTGNMQLNGMLYPLFVWLTNTSRKTFIVNFLDDNRLILQIENKLAWIIRAYIKATLSK